MALRILITNNTLGQIGGSEAFALETCKHLLVKGHHPIAYSALHGMAATKIRAMGATTVDSLEGVPPPDIIHGHHHLDTTYACVTFPDTPCIHFCHGIAPWEELPAARLSNIITYIAISDLVRNHLATNGVPEEKIRVIRNFVDNTRFCPFPATDAELQKPERLPERGKRALLYGNYAHKYSDIIDQACSASGYTLDLIGLPWGNSTGEPEEILPHYDVVFCYGKSALESLYCGADVVLSGSGGIGPLVDETNFEMLRRRNFGITTCLERSDVGSLSQLLGDIYKARLRGKWPISIQQRDSLSATHAIEQIIGCYKHAIDNSEAIRYSQSTKEEDRRALARYIHFLQSSRLGQAIDFFPAESRKLLEAKLENDRLSELCSELKASEQAAKDREQAAKADLAQALERETRLRDTLKQLLRELIHASMKRSRLTSRLFQARFPCE